MNETRRARHVPALLIEGLLIVLSVALGFAVTQWQDRRRDEQLADEALVNFRRELGQNLTLLESVQPKHVELSRQLERAAATVRPGQTGFDGLREAYTASGAASVPPLADAAWQTAVSTGALRLLGYERAARISETYQVQNTTFFQTILRLENRLTSPENFDPASRAAMLRTQALLFSEVEGQERYLIERYRATLKQLGPQ